MKHAAGAVGGIALLAPIRAVHECIPVRKLARVLVCGLATGLAGCMSFPDVPPREYYVLEDLAKAGASRSAVPAGRVLLVSMATASPFYDTQNLVFSRSPGQRAYYQFAGWTERPGRRLTDLLVRRLDARGSFKSVATTTAGIKGDFVLSTRLEEFYHDSGANPGSVRIEVSAELVDYAARTIVAQRRFAQSAPVAGENAQAAVGSFNRAATTLIDEISVWLEGVAAQPVVR